MAITNLSKLSSIYDLSTGYSLADYLTDYYQDQQINIGNTDDAGDIYNASNIVLHPDWYLRDGVDKYMCVNPILNPLANRDSSNISKVMWLHADLDIAHDVELSDQEMIAEYESVLETIEVAGLPQPTIVNYTGRGLLVMWRVKHYGKDIAHNHTHTIEMWSEVQRAIYNLLKDYKADPTTVGDTARIYRVIGSTNSHNGARVTNILHTETVADLNEVADLLGVTKPSDKMTACIERLQEYGAPAEVITNRKQAWEYIAKYSGTCSKPASEAQVKYATDIAEALDIDLPETVNWFTLNDFIQSNKIIYNNKIGNSRYKSANSYHANTAYVVGNIIESMAIRGEIVEGCRESLLSLYHHTVWTYTQDESIALERLEELNNSIATPLTARELRECKLIKAPYAHASWLERVTGCNYYELKSDYYTGKTYDRKESAHKYYINQLAKRGETTKASKIEIRRSKVAELREQGLSQSVIAERLDCSLRTIKNDYKYLDQINGAKNYDVLIIDNINSNRETKGEDIMNNLITIEVEESTPEIDAILPHTYEPTEEEKIEIAMQEAAIEAEIHNSIYHRYVDRTYKHHMSPKENERRADWLSYKPNRTSAREELAYALLSHYYSYNYHSEYVKASYEEIGNVAIKLRDGRLIRSSDLKRVMWGLGFCKINNTPCNYSRHQLIELWVDGFEASKRKAIAEGEIKSSNDTTIAYKMTSLPPLLTVSLDDWINVITGRTTIAKVGY